MFGTGSVCSRKTIISSSPVAVIQFSYFPCLFPMLSDFSEAGPSSPTIFCFLYVWQTVVLHTLFFSSIISALILLLHRLLQYPWRDWDDITALIKAVQHKSPIVLFKFEMSTIMSGLALFVYFPDTSALHAPKELLLQGYGHSTKFNFS